MRKKQQDVCEDPMLEQLRERVSELENENASLRRLDDTVRRNARLFQAVLRKSRDGLLLVTPEMTFLRTIHSVLGNADEDLVGRSLLTAVHPSDRALVREAFIRLLSNPSEGAAVECRVADKGGQWRWMEVDMTDMLDDPDVQAIVLNSRDITQRKKFEERVQELQSQQRRGECQTPTGRSAPE